MAEQRNVFIKSKMNKDLDERLLTPGEYRDAVNISISKTEGPDEGVVENILGNAQLTNFTWTGMDDVDIIGYYADVNKDRIYLFATNYVDSTSNNLSGFPLGDTLVGPKTVVGARCFIACRDLQTNSEEVLVEGTFLNFSKTHPITGVDLIEDLLFWTDDRNQPRKINVETAIANPLTHYTNEDHISVAKYAPHEPISLVYNSGADILSGMINETEEYLPASALAVVDSWTNSPPANTFTIRRLNSDLFDSGSMQMVFKNLNFPELGFFKLTNVAGLTLTFDYPVPTGTGAQAGNVASQTALQYTDPLRNIFHPNDVLAFYIPNPEYNSNFTGDEEYLKDKFLRFSYRFQYEDNEYSLMAPFTQAIFVPQQYGYFVDSAYMSDTISFGGPAVNVQPGVGLTRADEKQTAESGIVKFMENQITNAKLNIQFPFIYGNNATRVTRATLATAYKIKNIQILVKESDGLAIKVVDEIDTTSIDFTTTDPTNDFYIYNYLSNKAIKALTEADTTRIHDKAPVRALAQAVSGNRVIYGNFIEKHGSPEFLDYNLAVSEKLILGSGSGQSQQRKEYPNHTVKQNRSYKVGVVLVDRYGRSSNVILRDPEIALTAGEKDSTIYAPYSGGGTSPLNWPGNNIKVTFEQVIPQNKLPNGYPGLFSSTNPTGYYSYKIVVQQQEQEYYNVYLPGACSGKITFTGQVGTSAVSGVGALSYDNANTTSNIVLYGDNINKVPKDLADVGPTEEIYGSETLLFPRVATKYIVATSNISDTTLGAASQVAQLANAQSSQVPYKYLFEVNSIQSFKDLGEWTTNRNLNPVANTVYPVSGVNSVDPLFLGASSNPFVAEINTSFLVGYSPVKQTATVAEFSKNLNVFETDPVKSNLEIYWETSTSGNIQLLNDDIITGTGAVIGEDVTNMNFSMFEDQVPSPLAYVTSIFEPIDAAGNILTTGTMTLLNVTNGDGVVIANSGFELGQFGLPNAQYRIACTSRPTSGTWLTYYGESATQRTINLQLDILFCMVIHIYQWIILLDLLL